MTHAVHARPTAPPDGRAALDNDCDCCEIIAKTSAVFVGVMAVLAAYMFLHFVASILIAGVTVVLAYHIFAGPCSDPLVVVPSPVYTTTTMRPLYHQQVTPVYTTHSYQPFYTPPPVVYQQPVRQHYVTTTTYSSPTPSYAETRAVPGGRGAVAVNYTSSPSYGYTSSSCSSCPPPLPPYAGAGQHAVPRHGPS